MTKESKNWNMVDAISHYRHDWMNRLQLIKGNLSLEKYDRVNEIMEEIIIEAQQESRLCNLKAPELAGNLISFGWERHLFSMEYEIVGNTFHLDSLDRSLSAWCKDFFALLDHCAGDRCENQLVLTIEMSEELGQVRFFLDFHGMLKDMERLHTYFMKLPDHQLSELTITAEEFTAAVIFYTK
ncbi:Spo0B domain-containing protein [Metabacillus sp. KIGAM252]|uniref:Spo0B domain-containing protein n=1 Tax=Metabacillus flavus TaxID=2823519 RepID=A0ABS5LGI5_9BACI|nr:Spo0B C-terminal domain-containing protein [Metabacillus flavus]MBS2969865.1 Spo0B domain-containing protein [Metabacillus flavus]